MSLNTSKDIGPNTIPTKILKLLIDGVSSQLTELFNLSCSRGAFPLILKTSKVIAVYKKYSKLTLHKKPYFIFPNVLKDEISKKIALEYDLSCIIRKDDISFPRKYDLIL